MLSSYNFENAGLSDAPLSAAKYCHSWHTLRKAGWIVTGAGLGMLALGVIGGGLLAVDSDAASVTGLIFLVTGVTAGLPLVAVGTPLLIVAGSDKKQMLRTISCAKLLQERKQ